MTSESKDSTGSAVAVWDHEASSYDALRQADPVYSSCIRQAASAIQKGTRLCLDAGCGTGLSTILLSDRCNLVIAVDYSIESLTILKNKHLANVLLVQADLTSLPFKDSAFDASVCANTLQHFRPSGPQQRAVAELGRITKENGTLSVSVHHYSKGKQRAGWIKEGKPGQPGIDYIFRFSRDDLLSLIPGSLIKGVGYYGLLRLPFFGSRLQDLLARVFGGVAAFFGVGHMLIAVTTKCNPDTIVKYGAPNRIRENTRGGQV